MSFEYHDEKFHYDESIDKSEFQGAMFVVDIDESKLDDILSEKDQVIIKQDFDCYCFHVKREPRYFHVKGPKGQPLTNRYVIKELIEQKMNLECNHMFLEGFIKKTECQLEVMTGA